MDGIAYAAGGTMGGGGGGLQVEDAPVPRRDRPNREIGGMDVALSLEDREYGSYLRTFREEPEAAGTGAGAGAGAGGRGGRGGREGMVDGPAR